MSSASIPAVFQPRYVDGRYHMDGGTVWNTNIATAIQKCYEKTGDYSKISLDIANCDAHHPVFNNETSHNALENYMRQRAIHKFHKKTNDILEVKRAYPEVNYRYYFQPSGETNSGLSELDFYNSTTWRVNEMGRRDAKATLEAGENFGFEMLEQYHFNQEVKKAYPNYTDYFKKMFGFE
uniref:PNPLA domain-containing protein n=1 Tax=Strombidinopsis acuminata TaxID=141414 RepID=A0A7S3RP07_9SPIT|mmetsp:Transcript_114353/g.158770  ORF Transcript_114353/g.158770 Transcript_114353/m.158770 type:complete len:180 (+) Transcript_114353:519-1058(+)